MRRLMILHIPHSSRIIPEEVRDQFVLSDDELDAELTRMTDAFTDELFAFPDTTTVRFPISRLVVDVERFADDAKEVMAKKGMGVVYTRTAHGKKLRRELRPHEREDLISRFYDTHHEELREAVRDELKRYGRAFIIDGHSFPSWPLPCDMDQSTPRPEFCVGTDPFHTPEALAQVAIRQLEKTGYSVKENSPFDGVLVPIAFYREDQRVASIMVEVNRSLYMDEETGARTSGFGRTKEYVQTLLRSLSVF